MTYQRHAVTKIEPRFQSMRKTKRNMALELAYIGYFRISRSPPTPRNILLHISTIPQRFYSLRSNDHLPITTPFAMNFGSRVPSVGLLMTSVIK